MPDTALPDLAPDLAPAPAGRRQPRPGTSATSLSPSRAGDFVQCPLLYRLRTVDRLPEPPSEAAARGTLVHAVLERLFDLPAAERTLDAASGMVDGQWERLREQEPALAGLFAAAAPTCAAGTGEADRDGEEGRGADRGGAEGDVPERAGAVGEEQVWLASAHQLLGRYFELEDPTRLEPAERELYVEVELGTGLVLRGYVDRLDVSPTGDLRVVDYKTGRAPGEAFESRAMFQMRFYALVLWRLRGVVPRLLQLMYLGDGQVLRYSPDEAELRATERRLEAVWSAIQRATETGDWRPRRSKLCGWCPHQALCPEFGGTPPPLPERAAGPVLVDLAAPTSAVPSSPAVPAAAGTPVGGRAVP